LRIERADTLVSFDGVHKFFAFSRHLKFNVVATRRVSRIAPGGGDASDSIYRVGEAESPIRLHRWRSYDELLATTRNFADPNEFANTHEHSPFQYTVMEVDLVSKERARTTSVLRYIPGVPYAANEIVTRTIPALQRRCSCCRFQLAS